MSGIACYLLLSVMVLMTVVCSGNNPVKPSPVWNIDSQCKNRGNYSGACITQNNVNNELTCLRLACAKRIGDRYLAIYTKRVNDNTICGNGKVCERGVCVFKNLPGVAIPVGVRGQYYCDSLPIIPIPDYPQASNKRPAVKVLTHNGRRVAQSNALTSNGHSGSRGH